MPLTQLSVRDFRCFEAIDAPLDTNHNLIVGPNASGKTSFLESIYFLGRGRSFRVAQSQRLVRQDTPGFTVSGQVSRDDARSIPIGVKFRPGDTLIKVDGQRCTGFASLAESLPVQVIHPDVHQLVEGGPGFRRRFLDWGVFHVKQNFLGDWREFSRALKQRNSGLRQNLPPAQLNTWTSALVAAGERVNTARADYTQQLAPFVVTTSVALLGQALEIQYKPGWREELTFPGGPGCQPGTRPGASDHPRWATTGRIGFISGWLGGSGSYFPWPAEVIGCYFDSCPSSVVRVFETPK